MTLGQTVDTFTDLDDPDWLALFENIEQSWFRLETLQVYSVEYERDEYERFMRERRLDREPGSWQQMITRHTRAGRSLKRVHVIKEPLTDYLHYEFAAYRQNSQAGEGVQLIPTSSSDWPSDLPHGQDFWLLDDRDVWDMHYDTAGRFLRATRSDSQAHLSECRRWRNAALSQAISLADYLREAA